MIFPSRLSKNGVENGDPKERKKIEAEGIIRKRITMIEEGEEVAAPALGGKGVQGARMTNTSKWESPCGMRSYVLAAGMKQFLRVDRDRHTCFQAQFTIGNR